MALKTSAHQFFTRVVFIGVVCFAGVACSSQSNLMNLPDLPALRRTMESMRSEYGTDWVQADAYFERLAALESQIGEWDAFCRKGADGDAGAQEIAAELGRLQRDVLSKGPALNGAQVVMVRRHTRRLGLPQNWQGNSSLPRDGYDNEIVELTLQPDNDEKPFVLRTIYRPEKEVFVGDICLHWNGDRLLFSSLNPEGRWHVYEIGVDGTGLQQLTPDSHPDVDYYDACYLPDGRIMLCSTAGYRGVPCVYGGDHVANLFLLDRETGSIRQLCFDQDHNWSPRVPPNGRVLYQRWEYSDTPHSNSRMLFHMNPDGTDQREYWGSGVYFPNSFFYARPLPGKTGRVVGIASGHHGTQRSGRLLLVEPDDGRGEGDGVLQEIPGWGKPVTPIIRDRLVDGVWPHFLHPYPLTDTQFLVSAKLGEDRPWGIYLVDIYDNMLPLAEEDSYAFLEPIPLRKEPCPPVLPDRVNLAESEGVVYLQDIYEGGGLAGVPKGAVTALRVFQYYFSHRSQGGLHGVLGNDCGWDIKRVLGTVPVQPDGSACFRAPANTPIAVQPLDAEGQALQIMRSWFTLQPGEKASCVGCHESQKTAPFSASASAFRRVPSAITPGWHAPHRGFSFVREVQPVLDRYCAGCHGDVPPEGMSVKRGREFPYLRGDRMVQDWSTRISGGVGPEMGGVFSESYAALQRFVRRPGIESDLHMLSPMDFHFNTTELGQLLRKGHYNVRMDTESRERLAVWVDLNAPFHGTWRETHPRQDSYALECVARAAELRQTFAPFGAETDFEKVPQLPEKDRTFLMPEPSVSPQDPVPEVSGWPFNEVEARRKQTEAALSTAPGGNTEHAVNLAPGVDMTFVLVPGGRFVMGTNNGCQDEMPASAVEVPAFLLGKFEVTNAQYRIFDPSHESRDESRNGYQFGRRGFCLDGPQQPVVRVSWEEALDFCDWLSRTAGLEAGLPTEAQWEWAARAGSDQSFYFGSEEADCSAYANLADRKLREFIQCTARDNYGRADVIENASRHDDRIPRDDRYDDRGMVSVDVGRYLPNAWNLHDMHGNVGEWTMSAYFSYPYRDEDGRNDAGNLQIDRVARGGSWRDRPYRAAATFRLPYRPYQRVFNVGFRVAVKMTDPLTGPVRTALDAANLNK
ncbi:MAG TPA: SUMF1/EgtB/PvdO family nonheme iron enzyme [Candidatus Hydrogenedentes bacterium]|nr:SUMF1/EgtB/PvdO family nonheme iron enzyme [Candidatus Hydrogenedentota bacterium]